MSECSGPALVDRSSRRWLTSAAIVVLLHAGLAVGVLTWRSMRAAPPIEIDLTPSPLASGQNVAPALPRAAQQSEANRDVVATGQDAGSNRAEPGMTAPQLQTSSPGGAEADRAGGTMGAVAPPVPNGLASGGPRPSSPMANMPLDSSITVQPTVRRNGAIGPLASRETGPLDRTPMSEFRPAKPFGVPDIPRNAARGARVQDRARAAVARSMGRIGTTKNSIGGAAAVVASRGEATGLNAGITRNAIGVTTNFRPRISRANAGDNRIGFTAVVGHAMPTAPVINGHGFARSTIGPAMIGGPARASGILSGNDFSSPALMVGRGCTIDRTWSR